MKKRNLILSGIAVLMILVASVPSALAYFTTYVYAEGKKTVVLGDRTTIQEPAVDKWIKQIQITADETSEPVYVRAKAFAPDDYVLSYSGTNWKPGEADDFYYYGNPISKDNKNADLLNVQIKMKDGTLPPDGKEGETFNVVVIYEYTPVLYKEDKDGNLVPYADWTKDVTPGPKVNQSSTTPTQSDPASGSGTGTETGGGNG
jgi:hypothetical protein